MKENETKNITSEVINKIIPVLKKILFINLCSINKSLSRLTSLNQDKITKIEINNKMLTPTFIDKYKNGSVPNGETTQEEVDEIKELLVSTLNQTITDFEKGKFTSYNEYQTKTGFLLRNSEDAIQFNNYHEGIHLGFIMKIKKYIK